MYIVYLKNITCTNSNFVILQTQPKTKVLQCNVICLKLISPYLRDPFPSQKVSTHGAFWWLMSGNVSKGAARIGAISVPPTSVSSCLKWKDIDYFTKLNGIIRHDKKFCSNRTECGYLCFYLKCHYELLFNTNIIWSRIISYLSIVLLLAYSRNKNFIQDLEAE